MKLRVVGWASYDDHIEEGVSNWAAHHAVVDAVKKHGYLFSGLSHQEGYNCAPVLNDGKMQRYSQRGWGGVMAEAHGYTGRLDYTHYAFMMDPDEEIRPQEEFDIDDFTPETDLNERFDLAVEESVFDAASNGEIKLDNLPELRYLDVGDTLALHFGDKTEEYIVRELERKKDLTDDELLDLQMAFHDFRNKDRKKHAEKIYDDTKIVMIITLKK